MLGSATSNFETLCVAWCKWPKTNAWCLSHSQWMNQWRLWSCWNWLSLTPGAITETAFDPGGRRCFTIGHAMLSWFEGCHQFFFDFFPIAQIAGPCCLRGEVRRNIFVEAGFSSSHISQRCYDLFTYQPKMLQTLHQEEKIRDLELCIAFVWDHCCVVIVIRRSLFISCIWPTFSTDPCAGALRPISCLHPFSSKGPRKGQKKLLHLVKSVSSKLLCFCKQMMLSAGVHIMASQTSSGRKQMHLILKQVQNMFFLILLEWLHDVGFAGTSKCVHFIGNPEPPWHQEQPPLKCSLRVWRQASIHHQRCFQLWYERHYVMSNLLWSGLFPLEVLILMCFSLWWTYIAAWLVHFADKFQSMILDWHTPRGRLHLFGLWCDAWEGATCPAGIPHDLTDWHDCFRLKWLQAIMSLTEARGLKSLPKEPRWILQKRMMMVAMMVARARRARAVVFLQLHRPIVSWLLW